jgi:hypothetical protein
MTYLAESLVLALELGTALELTLSIESAVMETEDGPGVDSSRDHGRRQGRRPDQR